MKTKIFITCIFFFVISVGFSGWAQSETIKLRFGSFIPAKHPQTKVQAAWAEKIGKLTNGKVNIKMFAGGALGKPTAQYMSLKKGVMDIAFVVPSYTPGEFPLSAFIDLPFIFDSGEQASKVLWKVYEKYLRDEYKDVVPLWMYTTEPGMFHMTKKQVKTLEDLKGLKLHTSSTTSAKAMTKLGAVPMMGNIMEWYESMERGVSDGVQVPMNTMPGFRFQEVVKYHTMTNFAVAGFLVAMNKKAFNKLPADVQKVIMDNSGLEMAVISGKTYDKVGEFGIGMAKKAGNTFYSLPSAERKRWVEKTLPVSEEWVKDMEKKGLPGKEVLEYALELSTQP
jgi:TRAP-type C4-dicarboxylate transport system substrate-binding protein